MRLHLLLPLALIVAAQARTEDVLNIPPVSTSLDVKGHGVKITAWGTVSNEPQGISKLALTADLGDLQDNIAALLAAQLDRSDRCGERLSVERATLAPASPSAILTAQLHVERWACAKALGREIVKRLVGGNAAIAVKLTPRVTPDGISVASEVQTMDADGSLGELLRSDSFGPVIKEKIAAAIESSLHKALDLRTALPPPLAAAATLRTAQFAASPEGRLRFQLDGEVRLPK